MFEIKSLNNFDAILFDLDGTLVDSMALHNAAWISTLADYGCSMTIEILNQYAGIPNHQTVAIFNQRFSWNLVADTVVVEKERRFFENLNQLQAIESVVNVAKEALGKIPMAVVSGSSRALIRKVLKTVGLESFFPVYVGAEDTSLHKPNPDPFLKAAKLLQVNASRCLVFEDGEAGISAAKSAGMKVVRVIDSKLKLEL